MSEPEAESYYVANTFHGPITVRFFHYCGVDELRRTRHKYGIKTAKDSEVKTLSVGNEVHEYIQATPNWCMSLAKVHCSRGFEEKRMPITFVQTHSSLANVRSLAFRQQFLKSFNPADGGNLQSLYSFFEENNHVSYLLLNIDNGIITAERIRDFVEQDLMHDFISGKPFYFDYTMAALVYAVSIKSNDAHFRSFLKVVANSSESYMISRTLAKKIMGV